MKKMCQELRDRENNKNIDLLIEKKSFVNDITFLRLLKINIAKDKTVL